MGPYCKFCDNRCFVHMPENTPYEIQKAYGEFGMSMILATCAAGQAYEKEKVGYCYDDIMESLKTNPAI